MKKQIIQLSVLTLILLTIFSCMGKDGVTGVDGADGQDGADGRAAIAYSWMGNIWDIWSTDPTIPQTFYNGTYYYYATLGTYSYGYSGDGGSWTGYYTIYINEGEPGEPGTPGEPGKEGGWFWQDGADGADGIDGADGDDGEDMCFELYMYSYIGPSFYEWYCSWEGIDLPRTTSNPNAESNNRYEIDLNNEMKNYENENQVITEDKLVKFDKDIFDEFDFVNSIDENPNSVTESGKIGKFHFIHKFIKVE